MVQHTSGMRQYMGLEFSLIKQRSCLDTSSHNFFVHLSRNAGNWFFFTWLNKVCTKQMCWTRDFFLSKLIWLIFFILISPQETDMDAYVGLMQWMISLIPTWLKSLFISFMWSDSLPANYRNLGDRKFPRIVCLN